MKSGPDNAMKNDDNELYFAVPPTHLLPSTSGNFEIYLKQGEKFVLYTRSGEKFTPEHRQNLVDRGIRRIFIPSGHRNDYEHYVGKNIGLILDDETIPVEDRAETWSGTASSLSRNMFETELPGKLLKRRFKKFEQLIESSARFFQNPKALKELSNFIAKGEESYHHGLGTMIYTLNVLQVLEFDDLTATSCALGAMLHDIGKTRLPEELVNKDPCLLTEDECAVMATHPVIGIQISAVIPLLAEAIHCVLFHHEREDGGGYPSGALGEEIPIYAKAVAVCNRYDNLTREHPHKSARQPYEALQIIMADRGFYDRKVLKALVKVLSEAEIT